MVSKILVPVDPDEADFATPSIEYAAELASRDGAVIRLIGVTPILAGYGTEYVPASIEVATEHDAQAKLAVLARMAEAHGGKADTVIRLGSVAPEVLEEAKVWGADLIVISSHKPRLATYLLGSSATQIVRHALCSVMVLRG